MSEAHVMAAPGCGVDEAALARPPGRYAMHDAVEADDDVELARLMKLEDADEDYDPTAGSRGVTLDRNERDNHGCAPVHVAALNASSRCFNLLLAKGAKLNSKCNGSPLVHVLLSMAPLPHARAFVREALAAVTAMPKLDLAATDDGGRTWLHACAAPGAANIAVELVDIIARSPQATGASAATCGEGAIVNTADRYGRRPAHAAAAIRCLPMLQRLAAAGADFAASDMRQVRAAVVVPGRVVVPRGAGGERGGGVGMCGVGMCGSRMTVRRTRPHTLLPRPAGKR